MVSLIHLWLTPLLLLALPAQVMAYGREGLWLVLTVVSGPLLFLSIRSSSGASLEDLLAMPLVKLSVAVGAAFHLWAVLSLLGDLAGEREMPRWGGVMVGALLVFSGPRWLSSDRSRRTWAVTTLAAFVIPLALVMWKTNINPLQVFSQAASRSAVRFEPESPWVTEGRSLSGRGREQWVEFSEEHHLAATSAGVVRLAFIDGSRRLLEERTVAQGQELVMRPGDWLQADPAVRFRFEPGKRIPRAPLNGTEWASSVASPFSHTLERLGLALTLFGGAMAWPSFFLSPPLRVTRRRVLSTGFVLLFVAVWGECWGVYATRFAPELYLNGVTYPSLLRLPILAIREGWLGQWLVASVGAGTLLVFVGSAPALGRSLWPGLGQQGRQIILFACIAAVGGLAAFFTTPVWEVALLGFGAGAVTLAPLMVIGPTARWGNRAAGLSLFLYLALVLIAWSPVGAAVSASALRLPVIGVLPLTVLVLWAARWWPSSRVAGSQGS